MYPLDGSLISTENLIPCCKMIYKIKFINKQVLIVIYYYLVITTVIQMIGVKVNK